MILIKNANIINPAGSYAGKGDILLHEGAVLEVGPFLPNLDADVYDARGKYALPGLVDMHCHLREPGYEYKETIATGTRAAALGGFTSVACMPNTLPVADNPAVIRYIYEKAKQANAARVYPIGCISKGQAGEELSEMAALQEAGAVALSDDGKPVSNPQLMRMALKYAAGFDILLISHCEDLALVAGGQLNEGYTSTVTGLKPNTRAAEEVMIAREILLAESLGCRVHIAHVSTEGGVSLLRYAKARGVQVSAETCPHYFCATDKLALDFDTNAKVNPPLRTPKDVEAVIAGIQDGTLDAIATDHAPHHLDEKRVEFDKAANGISGLETALSLAYTKLVLPGLLNLDTLVQRMAIAPAQLLGISGGTLSPGTPGDVVLFDPQATWTVDPQAFASKGKNTPFAGWELQGKVTHTFVNGEAVVVDGALVDA